VNERTRGVGGWMNEPGGWGGELSRQEGSVGSGAGGS